MTQNEKARESIITVQRFFALVDSASLFAHRDPLFCRKIRQDVLAAISYLLFWGRSTLEVARGLHWPYEGLRKRYEIFREIAVGEEQDHMRQQALFAV